MLNELPKDEQLSEEQLDAVSGGVFASLDGGGSGGVGRFPAPAPRGATIPRAPIAPVAPVVTRSATIPKTPVSAKRR